LTHSKILSVERRLRRTVQSFFAKALVDLFEPAHHAIRAVMILLPFWAVSPSCLAHSGFEKLNCGVSHFVGISRTGKNHSPVPDQIRIAPTAVATGRAAAMA
jgi:hypothetical protein